MYKTQLCAQLNYSLQFSLRERVSLESQAYHMFSAVDNAGTCSIFVCVEANVKKKRRKMVRFFSLDDAIDLVRERWEEG